MLPWAVAAKRDISQALIQASTRRSFQALLSSATLDMQSHMYNACNVSYDITGCLISVL